MTLNEAIREVLEPIDHDLMFDSHFVIRRLTEMHLNVYEACLQSHAPSDASIARTHASVAQAIGENNDLVEKMPQFAYSHHLFGKPSQCALWQRR